jgi:hypothetical protein
VLAAPSESSALSFSGGTAPADGGANPVVEWALVPATLAVDIDESAPDPDPAAAPALRAGGRVPVGDAMRDADERSYEVWDADEDEDEGVDVDTRDDCACECDDERRPPSGEVGGDGRSGDCFACACSGGDDDGDSTRLERATSRSALCSESDDAV